MCITANTSVYNISCCCYCFNNDCFKKFFSVFSFFFFCFYFLNFCGLLMLLSALTFLATAFAHTRVTFIYIKLQLHTYTIGTTHICWFLLFFLPNLPAYPTLDGLHAVLIWLCFYYLFVYNNNNYNNNCSLMSLLSCVPLFPTYTIITAYLLFFSAYNHFVSNNTCSLDLQTTTVLAILLQTRQTELLLLLVLSLYSPTQTVWPTFLKYNVRVLAFSRTLPQLHCCLCFLFTLLVLR